MDNKYFGPRIPGRVLNRNDRLQQLWNDVNRAAKSDPAAKKLIRDGFDGGKQPADMGEDWEKLLKQRAELTKNPPLTEEEKEKKRRREAYEKAMQGQKEKKKT